MNTLDILPVKQGITYNTVDFPDHLPDINTGSILTLIAPPKSGKSVLISNLFLRASFFKDKFDKIYIFSTTACNGDNSCRFLVEDDDVKIFSSYSNKMLQDILDYQESFDVEDRPRISIVFDDFLSFPALKRNSLMFTLASMYRHYGIKLLVYSSQILSCSIMVIRKKLKKFTMRSVHVSDQERDSLTYFTRLLNYRIISFILTFTIALHVPIEIFLN